MRLIDADALAPMVKRLIELTPTVDPVKHGRWELLGKCSICGGDAPFWPMASTYYQSNYCPNCGAKMDEEGV